MRRICAYCRRTSANLLVAALPAMAIMRNRGNSQRHVLTWFAGIPEEQRSLSYETLENGLYRVLIREIFAMRLHVRRSRNRRHMIDAYCEWEQFIPCPPVRLRHPRAPRPTRLPRAFARPKAPPSHERAHPGWSILPSMRITPQRC